MKVITAAELVEILRKHKMWLTSEPGGERADLTGANLYGANLYRANLSRADLTGADLYGADLSKANLSRADLTRADLTRADLTGADLTGANLSRADLTGADLTGADLYGADLSRADLTGADLTGADLYGANLYRANLSKANLYRADLTGADLYGANLYRANLSGADNVNYPLACPEKGSFIAFKKVRKDYIVELEIPADALRSSANSRKCRCSHAKVIAFTNLDGTPAEVDVVYSNYDSNFEYRIGEVVKVDDFDTNRWNECAPGIHFFITRQEAVEYIM